MNWSEVQRKLQTIVQSIHENSVLDAATGGLLNEIPFVGGFLSRYWDNLAPEDQSPEALAKLLESIAAQETTFNNLRSLVEDQGAQLIEQGKNLGTILLLVSETRDDTKEIKGQISRFVETLEIPTARAAFEQAAAMGEDRRRSIERIKKAEEVLESASVEADAPNYYQLGLLYLSMNAFEDAEACLLKALDLQPDLADALTGLAMIYQRRATEHLRDENYGLAETAAKRSESYVKSAQQYNPMDVGPIQVHLGYLYKDLAQRYADTGRTAKAQEATNTAWGCFETALKIDSDNASAHNGLGSLCLNKGDYNGAIEHITAAVKLQDDYLFAHFDLAQAYYLRTRSAQQEKTRRDAVLRGLESCQKVFELDHTPGHDSLPPHARQAIEQICQWLTLEANSITQSARKQEDG